MRRTILAIVLLSFAQQALAQSVYKMYLLPGDFNNVYGDELFDQNFVNSSKNEAYTYTSDNKAAVVSNLHELQTQPFTSGTQDCRASRSFDLNDGQNSKVIALVCGTNLVRMYKLGQDNKLSLDDDLSFETGSLSTSWDFYLSDPINGAGVAISYDTETSAATGPSIVFNSKTEDVYKRKVVDMHDFPVKMEDYLVVTAYDYDATAATNMLYVGYSKTLNPFETTSTNPNYFVYADVSDDSGATEKTGKVDLTSANGFCENVRSLFSITFDEKQGMYVTYVSTIATDIEVCVCQTAFDPAANTYTLSDCAKITGFNGYKAGGAMAMRPSTEQRGEIYIYTENHPETEERALEICEFDNNELLACNRNKNEPLLLNQGVEFHSFINTPFGVQTNFRKSEIPAGQNARIVTIAYNLVQDKEERLLTFQQSSDRAGYTMAINQQEGDTDAIVYAIMSNSYGIYGPDPSRYYISFIADNVEGESQLIKITRTLDTETETRSINMVVRKSLKVKIDVRPMPNIVDFVSPEQMTMPIGRYQYEGNNLEFKLADGSPSNVNFIGAVTSSAMPKLGNKVWFGFDRNPLILDGNDVVRGECNNFPFEGDLTCEKSSVKFTLQGGYQVVYVSTSKYAQNSGYVVVSSDGTGTDFHFIGVSNDEFSKYSITDRAAVEGGVYFQVLHMDGDSADAQKYSYTFFLADGTDIQVYGCETSDFAQFNPDVIEIIDYEKAEFDSPGLFCPTVVKGNGIDFTRIEVFSHCANGVSRLYTFKARSLQRISFESSKFLNNLEVGEGLLDICSFGNEHIVYSPGTKFLFTTDVQDDYSLNKLGEEFLNYNFIDGIHCIEGSEHAIYYGKNAGSGQFSIVNGNRPGDIDHRYFYTGPAAGELKSAFPTSYGYMLVFDNAGQFQAKAVVLNSPMVTLMPNTAMPETTVTVEITQQGQPAVPPTNSFKVTLTEYTPNLKVTKKGDFKTDKGEYDILEMADVTGDIFDVSVKVGPTVNSTVTLGQRVIEDDSYSPSESKDIEQPQILISDKTNPNVIGFYNSPNDLTLYMSYYNDFTQYVGRDILQYQTNVYDAIVNQDEFALICLVNNEGGQPVLRWVVKKMGSGVTTGFIDESFVAHDLTLVEISSTKYALLAINKVTNTGQTYILDVSQPGGDYKVTTTKGTRFLRSKLFLNK